jgi:uncharacterized protein
VKNEFKVLDSDMHVFEPVDLYERYLEPGYDGPVPKFIGDPDNLRWFAWQVGDRVMGRPLNPDHPHAKVTAASDPSYTEYIEAGFDNKSQLTAMDVEGIDLAALFPTAGAGIKDDDRMDPKHAAALSRAVNNWLGEFCSIAPDQMRPAAVLPLQDIGMAVAEAERAITELNAMCVVLPNRPVLSRPYYDPAYQPLWELLASTHTAAAFHGSGGRHEIDVSARYLNKHQAMYKIVSHTSDMSLVVLEMLLGGVLANNPDLRVAFLESFCGWVPWWLWRIDEGFELYGQDAGFPALAELPSTYFKRQCSVSIELDEPYVRKFIDELGSECLIASTDYPHHDSAFPHAMDMFTALDTLTKSEKQQILWNNCARLYAQEPVELPKE